MFVAEAKVLNSCSPLISHHTTRKPFSTSRAPLQTISETLKALRVLFGFPKTLSAVAIISYV
jgi:hypothetical protein